GHPADRAVANLFRGRHPRAVPPCVDPIRSGCIQRAGGAQRERVKGGIVRPLAESSASLSRSE
ncbi:MAG: hypothetical protein R3335_06530, partial [Anaerolineales bacterium]|nr:hypothetical protein [Anaerolineales bacterium]